ncbi:hypothetical protein PMIN06_004771 [Paraphaeosphaeria minitans]
MCRLEVDMSTRGIARLRVFMLLSPPLLILLPLLLLFFLLFILCCMADILGYSIYDSGVRVASQECRNPESRSKVAREELRRYLGARTVYVEEGHLVNSG